MKVLFATTEALPFVKVGGLSDVAAALPEALTAADPDIDVTVVLPLYRSIDVRAYDIPDPAESITVRVGGRERTCGVRELVKGPRLRFLFVEHRDYFDRDDPYTHGGKLYDDSAERFAFFSRVIVEIARRRGVDIVHANDWFTALVPVFLRADAAFARAASVLTIHNLSFQGRFWAADWPLLELDRRFFGADGLEFYGDINFLKGGIVYSDAVTTVSPTYAEQIRTAAFGCGLEGVLNAAAPKLRGILNGIDDAVWNPLTDEFLTGAYVPFGPGDTPGKATNKRALQRELGLNEDADAPLLVVVARLTDQKGMFLVQEVLDWLMQRRGVQFALLGRGEGRYEDWFRWKRGDHPGRMAVEIGGNERLAHLLLAGGDVFLMPSAYEPCGLTQMYAMRYGTLPVVHDTGGLRDTVVDLKAHPDSGTGYRMPFFSGQCLFDMATKAIDLMKRPDDLAAARRRGMTTDFSWRRPARAYLDVYRAAVNARAPRS